MTTCPDQGKPLEGFKIAVTAVDLEQQEHRGIATYSKALLKSLHNLGAEVWLLTQFKPNSEDIKRLPEESKQLIFAARLLNALCSGQQNPTQLHGRSAWLIRVMQWPLVIKQKLKTARTLIKLTLGTSPEIDQVINVPIAAISDNPQLNQIRLAYLQHVSGLISAAQLYRASTIRALFNRRDAIGIKLMGFDALVTTCPLYLEAKQPTITVQSIHDLIALEYPPHGENVRQFGLRLQQCGSSPKLYVSQATADQYQRHFQPEGKNSIQPISSSQHLNVAAQHSVQQVILQPPSIDLSQINPNHHSDIGIPSLNSGHRIYQSPNGSQAVASISIDPFRYVLFHSSIEPRKNADFLIHAYQRSGLAALGVHLCITGHIKEDSYSQHILRLAASHRMIHITGFIDEALKAELYLHALMACSPSLGEGFGIPVLDAACLGLPILASACESHREIANLFDFGTYVQVLQPSNPAEWGHATTMACEKQLSTITNPEKEKERRLKRYGNCHQKIVTQFESSLCSALTGALHHEH